MKKREKKWDEKVEIATNSFFRSSRNVTFACTFYENLFFLEPKLKNYFKDTNFPTQEKALMRGLQYLVGYLRKSDADAQKQIERLAKTHSRHNLNIHPHHYYYWIEALIMTAGELDKDWNSDMEYYWREVFSMPVFFIVSQYYK